MGRNRRIWLIIGLVLCSGFSAAFFGFRAYKLRRVEEETERYAAWLKNAVLDANPVRVIRAYGRKEPKWLGLTNIHVLLQTSTGAEFTINALIQSSLLDTRLVQLDLYYRAGMSVDQMTTTEIADELQHPTGVKVEIPVETVNSASPLDLKVLLPAAFTVSFRW
jgi:hypothetical protein